jgi:hypothetical protein
MKIWNIAQHFLCRFTEVSSSEFLKKRYFHQLGIPEKNVRDDVKIIFGQLFNVVSHRFLLKCNWNGNEFALYNLNIKIDKRNDTFWDYIFYETFNETKWNTFFDLTLIFLTYKRGSWPIFNGIFVYCKSHGFFCFLKCILFHCNIYLLGKVSLPNIWNIYKYI